MNFDNITFTQVLKKLGEDLVAHIGGALAVWAEVDARAASESATDGAVQLPPSGGRRGPPPQELLV